MTPEQYQEAARARLGATLKGKWRLDAVLGVGGTASVYSGSHRNGKRAAIKVLHPELSAKSEFRERFLREAYVGNHIEHPGALTVHDDDTTEDGCAFLVMDLLEGENLEARRSRKGGKLEPLEVLSLIDAVLDIVHAAHSKGVVHRDIKPENLFLTLENEVRLLDFGVAHIDVPEDPGQTLAGISMGTPAFMPPEQASAHWHEVDERSDLWAVGASMFVLMTGTYVYRGGTVNETLVQAITGTAPKIQTIEPSIPGLVAHIVDRALEREKSYRYESALEMQAEVRRAYRELQDAPEGARYSLSDGRVGTHSSPPGPPSPVPGVGTEPFELHTPDPIAARVETLPQRRHGVVWAVLGAAIALGVLLVWLGSSDEEVARPTAPARLVPIDEPVQAKALPAAPRDEAPVVSPASVSAEPGGTGAAEVSDLPPAEDPTPARKAAKPRVRKPAPAKPSEPAPGDDFNPFSKRH